MPPVSEHRFLISSFSFLIFRLVGRGMKPSLANLQASRDVKDILVMCWTFKPGVLRYGNFSSSLMLRQNKLDGLSAFRHYFSQFLALTTCQCRVVVVVISEANIGHTEASLWLLLPANIRLVIVIIGDLNIGHIEASLWLWLLANVRLVVVVISVVNIGHIEASS